MLSMRVGSSIFTEANFSYYSKETTPVFSKLLDADIAYPAQSSDIYRCRCYRMRGAVPVLIITDTFCGVSDFKPGGHHGIRSKIEANIIIVA